MKRILMILSVAVLLVFTACGDDDGTTTTEGMGDDTTTMAGMGGAVTIDMVDTEFDPRELQIEVGDTVTWVHMDGEQIHHVVSDTGVFDSGQMEAGEEFSYTFDEPGTYLFHCEIHPAEMTGTIVVVDPTETTEAFGDRETIDMVDTEFDPREVEIDTGGTVTWVHMDGEQIHHVVSDTGVFDSGQMEAGEEFSYTFDEPGTYLFHCEIHPAEMTGTITVADVDA